MANKPGTSTTNFEDIEKLDPVNRSTTDCPYPLDIIVQNIQNVVENQTDDEAPAREVNHALKLQGFKVVEKENGADLEFLSCEARPDNLNLPVEAAATNDQSATKTRFKKGHKRAWSMPNAHHRDKAVLVVAENNFRQEGPNKRHLVRYRLHPYTSNVENNAVISQLIESTRLDPDEDEIDVSYDEEEIANLGEDQAGHIRFKLARRFWEARWKVQNFELLPDWLQDNEFLKTGHRPPLPSFVNCFKSIFQLHTETGNIWTHLYGFVAFIGVAIFFLSRPNHLVYWKDKLVFSFFFIGAIFCLGLSFSFHTVQCHSQNVGKLFSKLDYSGITLLIVGSFVPFIYYGFYCRTFSMLTYVIMISVLGIAALIVSLWDKFAEPKFRPLRAIVFVAMGLSSIVPTVHLLITDGFEHMINYDSLHWTALMGLFYLLGAAIYAFRFPERCCPGRCDIFCHSHQLFHIFVIIAAFVHFHGISEMAMKRLQQGSCAEQLIARYGTEEFTDYFDQALRSYVF